MIFIEKCVVCGKETYGDSKFCNIHRDDVKKWYDSEWADYRREDEPHGKQP
jgi:hypothetical protein